MYEFTDSTNIYLVLPLPKALFQGLVFRENYTRHRFCPKDGKSIIEGENKHISTRKCKKQVMTSMTEHDLGK